MDKNERESNHTEARKLEARHLVTVDCETCKRAVVVEDIHTTRSSTAKGEVDKSLCSYCYDKLNLDGPGNELAILTYQHCLLCLQERPEDQSPRDWARLEFGWTELGFQVWCKRHEVNVAHIDFGGHKLRGNMTRPVPA